MQINDAVAGIHEWAHRKGFYSRECSPSGVVTCSHVSGSRAAQIMLVVTELAEAVEADRHGDEANYREEIADAVIRLFDLCGADRIDLDAEIAAKMVFNEARLERHGKRY